VLHGGALRSTWVMAPKITAEMRAALSHHPGQSVEVEDDETQRVYLLVDAERGRALAEQWIKDQLQVGLDAAARGETVDFDAAAIKAAGRQRTDVSG
jgi:hypothetical protein